MAKTFDQLEPRSALAAVAQDFYRRGWMPGSAGNLSMRALGEPPAAFWITASGLPKGQLDANDFLLLSLHDERVIERLHPAHRPSAETSIHRAVYTTFPDASACLHVHSVDACIALSRCPADVDILRLPPLEVIKIMDVWEQSPELDLPVFANWLDVRSIGREIERRFTASPPRLSALAIRDHGITVWGRTLQQAFNRVEALEFIMSYMARA